LPKDFGVGTDRILAAECQEHFENNMLVHLLVASDVIDVYGDHTSM